MKRREFIAGLGVAALPMVARAQQPTIRTVGILQAGPTGSLPQFEAPLRKGLSEMGYVEGRNLALEHRYAQNQLERLPELAADLIQRRVEVIVTLGSDAVAAAAKAATTTIPIVFDIGGDPVETNLVASLNRPGGNLTGFTAINAELTAKRLGLLHELLPQARRIANIVGNSPASPLIVKALQTAAARIGVQVEFLNANSSLEIDAAFNSLTRAGAEALVVNAGPPFTDHVPQVVTLATRHGLPAIYPVREAPQIGGLMSYATTADGVRQVGIYVGRILKGEKAADLPVVLPTKFEFIINLQAARALGITVPPTLLAIADEVIE
jgi:putative tryptophan/tyrosine transport system substrate-binding protein